MRRYTKEIREYINRPDLNDSLSRDSVKWYQLCSSLDVIEDTSLAIDAYVGMSHTYPLGQPNAGKRYLLLYGLLQVLQVQQDAVADLCESLGMQFRPSRHPELRPIRDIRNASTGHPSKQESAGSLLHHFVSRVSIGHDKFMLLSFDSDGKSRSNDVQIDSLLSPQRRVLGETLMQVIDKLCNLVAQIDSDAVL